MIVIISGPSGAGEDTIINKLEKQLGAKRIITTTTRAMRPKDSEGNPYYFISKEEFQEKLSAGEFFEHAQQYNDQWYGVTFAEIKKAQKSPDLYVWKIDYKGVQNAKQLLPDVKSILIKAPLEQLERRIRGRGGLADNLIAERMEYSKEWLQHEDLYDYEINNSDGRLKQSVKEVLTIIDKIKN